MVILLLAVGSCRKAGTWLVKNDDPVHADVMVLLMGGFSERVSQAADLYYEKVAGKVWIVEAEMGDNRILEARGVQRMGVSTQARFALMGLGIPADSIKILPCGATSTRMEAESVRDHLLTQSGIDTLLLVSSSSHTRRAFKIFEAALAPIDEPLALYCRPSIYSRFNAEKWWKNRNDFEEVIMEYLKLVNFYLFEKRELRKGLG